MSTEGDYIVETRPHGICVFGQVHVDEVGHILERCEREGYELLDGRIADALGAVVVATTREGQRKWRKSLDLEVTSE